MIKKQYLKTQSICKVTFSLPKEAAEGAKEVKVLGEFNNWSWENGALMKKGKDEYTAVLKLDTGRSYQFRYMIDNQRWENDWAADAYIPSPVDHVDNSVVHVDEIPAGDKTAAKKPALKKKALPKKGGTTAKKTTTAKATAPKKKAATKKAAAPKKTTKQKASTKADDLKKIEGVGPKIEQLLHADGIKTFADLAKAKKSKLQSILTAAGTRYKMHDPSTWAQQAKLANTNQWDKLKTLQDELKGGKKSR